MDNLFTINLNVVIISAVWMEKSWGYCKNKTESQRQEASIQNLRTPENSWLWQTLIDKSSSKSLHTYTETSFHPRANKFQSKTYQANSPTTQEHNPEHKNTGGQKSHQTYRHLKTLYFTLHCTRERRDPAPPSRTLMQASLSRKPWQVTCPSPPTGRNLHNKEEPQTFSIQKGHTKHSKLRKMKRQRSIQQVKEHDKCQ